MRVVVPVSTTDDPNAQGFRKLGGILSIAHPRAVIIFTLIAVLVAVITERGLPAFRLTVTLALAMALVQISIGVFNEYYDRELDAQSKPSRPIPAGLVSAPQAYQAAVVFGALGLGASATLGLDSLLVLAIAEAMGILYSVRLKRSMWSWLPYAVAYPIVPLWVWVSLGEFRPAMLLVYPVLMPFAVGVHLANQLRDYDEDAQQGISGVVHHLGKKTAGRLCVGLLFLSPLAPLATLYRHPDRAAILAALVALHWLLMVRCLPKKQEAYREDTWKTIFKRLQWSGPLMLIGWLLLRPP